MLLDAEQDRGQTTRGHVGHVIAALGMSGCIVWFLLVDHHALLDPLTFVLMGFALAANLASAAWGDGRMLVSGAFVAFVLAVAFLGPAPVFVIVVVAELGFWAVDRYRLSALPSNLFGNAAPPLAAAAILPVLADPSTWQFFVVLAGLAAVQLAANFVLIATLLAIDDGESVLDQLRSGTKFGSALAINVLLAVAAAEVYTSIGLGAVVFVLVSIAAFTYMARLVVTAQERTRQYASLSWGVLSGLLRTLDIRDPRAARHAAGVAAFSRDIAQFAGLSRQECELAHTAGLLHDIGRFGVSDRVMERGRTLTEEDWQGIREHPVLGADLLRDLGAYGPVGEIVRAHHERLDGRGYPDGLRGDDIPEVAKIVAVAEVYDTLTAEDTYRTPVSSFEALTELRRVSGSQLDGRYVEALSELLAGRGVDYRHADSADFDSELDLERRLNDAEIAIPAADEAAAR